MRFPTRRTARSTSPRPSGTATYAAIVGDRLLWVATPAPGPLVLSPVAGKPGADVIEPDALDEGQPGHHGSRFDLARLPLEAGPHVLRHADGRPLAGPAVGSVAAGAVYALTRDDTHALHVVRRPAPADPGLRAAQLLGDRVRLHLDLIEAGAHDLDLVDGERDGEGAVVSLPIGPDGTVVVGADDLSLLAPGERTLRLLVAGAPVRRRANDLADPGSGVPLPALHAPGAPGPRARLRWSTEATLVLRLVEPVG